jgi:hypothetical protein
MSPVRVRVSPSGKGLQSRRFSSSAGATQIASKPSRLPFPVFSAPFEDQIRAARHPGLRHEPMLVVGESEMVCGCGSCSALGYGSAADDVVGGAEGLRRRLGTALVATNIFAARPMASGAPWDAESLTDVHGPVLRLVQLATVGVSRSTIDNQHAQAKNTPRAVRWRTAVAASRRAWSCESRAVRSA